MKERKFLAVAKYPCRRVGLPKTHSRLWNLTFRRALEVNLTPERDKIHGPGPIRAFSLRHDFPRKGLHQPSHPTPRLQIQKLRIFVSKRSCR